VDRDVAGPGPWGRAALRIRRARRLADLLDRDHRGRGAGLPGRGARPAIPARLRRRGAGATRLRRDPRLVRSPEPRGVGLGIRNPRRRRRGGRRLRRLAPAVARSVGSPRTSRETARGRLHGPPMTAGDLRTRLATPGDAPAIAAIYNEGIADRIATF